MISDQDKLIGDIFSEDESDQSDPLHRQVGGNHYIRYTIQPVEFIVTNGLGFLEGSVIKRLCRIDSKIDPVTDLLKARHEIELLIKLKAEKLNADPKSKVSE